MYGYEDSCEVLNETAKGRLHYGSVLYGIRINVSFSFLVVWYSGPSPFLDLFACCLFLKT
jgi:hypothetical protein